MDVEVYNYYTEYILPCAVNILSEDDININFEISTSVSIIIYLLTYVHVFNDSNFKFF